MVWKTVLLAAALAADLKVQATTWNAENNYPWLSDQTGGESARMLQGLARGHEDADVHILGMQEIKSLGDWSVLRNVLWRKEKEFVASHLTQQLNAACDDPQVHKDHVDLLQKSNLFHDKLQGLVETFLEKTLSTSDLPAHEVTRCSPAHPLLAPCVSLGVARDPDAIQALQETWSLLHKKLDEHLDKAEVQFAADAEFTRLKAFKARVQAAVQELQEPFPNLFAQDRTAELRINMTHASEVYLQQAYPLWASSKPRYLWHDLELSLSRPTRPSAAGAFVAKIRQSLLEVSTLGNVRLDLEMAKSLAGLYHSARGLARAGLQQAQVTTQLKASTLGAATVGPGADADLLAVTQEVEDAVRAARTGLTALLRDFRAQSDARIKEAFHLPSIRLDGSDLLTGLVEQKYHSGSGGAVPLATCHGQSHFDTELRVLVNPTSRWRMERTRHAEDVENPADRMECGKVVNILALDFVHVGNEAGSPRRTSAQVCALNTHQSFSGTTQQRLAHLDAALRRVHGRAQCDLTVFLGDFNTRLHCEPGAPDDPAIGVHYSRQPLFDRGVASFQSVVQELCHGGTGYRGGRCGLPPSSRQAQADEMMQYLARSTVRCYESSHTAQYTVGDLYADEGTIQCQCFDGLTAKTGAKYFAVSPLVGSAEQQADVKERFQSGFKPCGSHKEQYCSSVSCGGWTRSSEHLQCLYRNRMTVAPGQGNPSVGSHDKGLVPVENPLLKYELREAGPVDFFPTYKMYQGDKAVEELEAKYEGKLLCTEHGGKLQCLTGDKKYKHNPAWTDRVLLSGAPTRTLSYGWQQTPSAYGSDHFPVQATFVASITADDWDVQEATGVPVGHGTRADVPDNVVADVDNVRMNPVSAASLGLLADQTNSVAFAEVSDDGAARESRHVRYHGHNLLAM